MELKDTVEIMLKYYQLKIRHDKLQKMVDNWYKLKFTPTRPFSAYVCKLSAMEDYMAILKSRAEQEGIKLV